ncbi:MAG TPA: glycerol-3-phosphate dehydrogenase/oxidase [Acidimicrobiales bacterium]|nr:glycerol-3-phosphate dehydrogenase/oxidase [Acidimicrobiales bacterium]
MAATTHDLLVVGGGVVGAGTALDAASRGLSVALVEARDYASGTSSRSSKLVHGGLRYLQMLDFRLVRESLTERGLLLQRLAPHLVRPVPFLHPLTRRWERPYVGAGLLLYDTMSLAPGLPRGLPRHRHLNRAAALRVFPALRPDALVGAVQYWDAQVDDARHTLTVVRTAAALGAAVANRAQVVDLIREGAAVVGARVRDLETGTELAVRAHRVVLATGVWTDETRALAGGPGRVHVRASKGVHLVVPRERIRADSGMILRTEKSVLFVIPWGRHWIVGTTDTDWALDRAHPAASRADVDYLIGHLNAVLVDPITREDVEGVYAGLRPLLAGESAETSALSREHSVTRPVPGLVVVAGGTYTTYRIMARDTVDAAVTGLDRPVPASRTAALPLLGADGWRRSVADRDRLAAASGLAPTTIDHLLGRYGSMTADVLAVVAQDRSFAEELPGGEGYLAGEVVYAVRAEAALHLPDVLVRRTRLSIEARDRGEAAAEPVARLLGRELGWAAGRVAHEVRYYRARLEAERQSQETLDDATADATRLGAPDLVETVPLARR